MNKISIKYTSIAKSLSSFSGLNLLDDLVHKFEIRNLLGGELPKKQRQRGFSSWNKFYAGILGFVAGADCLDDFDWYGNDPLFFKLTNSPSSETMGKFLRSFHPRKVEEIRKILPILALRIRLALEPKCYKIIFKMDSSDHQQYGKKQKKDDLDFNKNKVF